MEKIWSIIIDVIAIVAEIFTIDENELMEQIIRDNVSLAEAPIKGKNIFEYSRNSNGAKDYMALAQEVLKLK